MAIALRPPGLILVLTAFAWAVIASTTLWPLLGSPLGLHGFVAGIVAAFLVITLSTLRAPRAESR